MSTPPTTPTTIISSRDQARAALVAIRLPIKITPAYSLMPGCVARTSDEFDQGVQAALDASPTSEVLIERSL